MLPSNIPLQLPEILQAKTYFWTPAKNASVRRSNEERKLTEVEYFLQRAGFQNVERTHSSVRGRKGEIFVSFFYQESCHHVYKTLTVTKSGKRSNILTLKKLCNTDA